MREKDERIVKKEKGEETRFKRKTLITSHDHHHHKYSFDASLT